MSQTKKALKARANQQFVTSVLKSGSIPLPMLHKIKGKYLLLQDYNIEQNNFKMLVQNLPVYIPNSLQKLILCNNRIADEDMAHLIEAVANLPHGLKVFAVIQNGFAKKSLEMMCESYLPSNAAKNLTKIIIKDPVNHAYTFSNSTIMKSLNDNVHMLPRLKHLVL